MLKFRALVLVLACTAVQAEKQCAAYQWGAWTPCYGTTTCQDDPAVFNFPLQATTTDQGRAMMAHMMADKQRQMEYKAECRANGECPEFMDRDSEGEAQCVDGFASSYPCRNIDLLSFINITDLGYVEPATGEVIPALNDMWGWTDEQEGEEYAIVGLTGGSSFVRVTDPQNPEVLGFLYTHTHAITWRDMKVVNDHAYIVAESLDHGVQVFDLRRLRGRTADDFEYFEVDAHYDGIGRAHNIAANPDTQTLFVVGCTDVAGRSNYTVCEGGLHMIDVSDPQNPQFAGCYSDDGYTHDTHCVIYHGPDERYTGREICMAFNEDSLTVVDVTDREFPVMVAKSGYATCRYAHQGWLTEDHRFVFGDDELDEVVSTDRHTKTYFWDVQDLQNPTLKWIYQSAETSIDHNLYITGPWVVQSNYEAGLRFLYFDSETEEVVETGHFDVLPSRTTVTFSGTWSNYPWYKNGMVAVTSIDYGLFLVQPNYEAMEAEAGRSIGSGHQSRMRSVPEMDGSGECARVESRNCNC